MNARYAAAIDLSGRSAGFALMKDQELLCAASRPMRGRDSAELADFVAQQLAANGVELAEVSDWTVGSGPGSFTGLRLAAALAAGWTFGKEGVRTRCVPTAVALAARLETANGDRIGCLFDGRNRELIYFEVENFGGELVPTGESRVLNKEQAVEFFRTCPDRHLAALSVELPAIQLLLDDGTAAKVKPVEELDIAALAACGYRKFDNGLTDLVYIRPAVFTVPVQ
ncbi:tRNA (adenosine(37)-N6)-threonylcarbamoyltransferase complex dimerization subunit type 1 TsaB [Victivallis vadensis]|uniref:tRNA (adenosine(37)-N6)-threonylcarbamoyltransferase complex dimerization subunit type 1 TsaB n=1 Tax=Victivallis vadensis TaxID=172901 RepID=UPI0023F11D55|nr:tRNA (adenosine(37)-N6)-threonylcarbamoyltransferase complex dimerization subunit type 1 TsaB [Victivallis vadensis]